MYVAEARGCQKGAWLLQAAIEKLTSTWCAGIGYVATRRVPRERYALRTKVAAERVLDVPDRRTVALDDPFHGRDQVVRKAGASFT